MVFGRVTRGMLANIAGRSYNQFRPRRRRVRRPRTIQNTIVRTINAVKEKQHNYFGLQTIFPSIDSDWYDQTLTLLESDLTATSGEDDSCRRGDEILVTSVEIKAVISTGAEDGITDDLYNNMRIVLALWTGFGSNAPMYTLSYPIDKPLLRELIPGAAGAPRLIKKYLDQYIPLEVSGAGHAAGTGYIPKLVQFNYYKKFKTPIHITYNASTATSGDKILTLSVTSDSATLTNPGFVRGFVKMTFINK